MVTKLVVFQSKDIRRTLHNGEWWFSVADVVEALADSTDPRQYIKKMRQRDPELSSNWGTICTPLDLLAPDGKSRKTDCANTEGIFRIIQSIPSPKAEPFKRWLAKVGYGEIPPDPPLSKGGVTDAVRPQVPLGKRGARHQSSASPPLKKGDLGGFRFERTKP